MYMPPQKKVEVHGQKQNKYLIMASHDVPIHYCFSFVRVFEDSRILDVSAAVVPFPDHPGGRYISVVPAQCGAYCNSSVGGIASIDNWLIASYTNMYTAHVHVHNYDKFVHTYIHVYMYLCTTW